MNEGIETIFGNLPEATLQAELQRIDTELQRLSERKEVLVQVLASKVIEAIHE